MATAMMVLVLLLVVARWPAYPEVEGAQVDGHGHTPAEVDDDAREEQAEAREDLAQG